MTWTCKTICSDSKSAKRENYNLKKQAWCSICSKMFLKKDQPNNRCFCCNNVLRTKSKTRKNNKARKYIE